MPRVQKRTKAARGKPYTCSTCGQPIEPGEDFYYWSFRYGGTRRAHTSHGSPRASQLTQARIGEVYAELEGVQDMVDKDPSEWTKDDARDAMQSVAEVAQEIADEARSTADDHFSGGGPHAERADEMEEVVSQLEDAVQQIDDVEEPEEQEQDALHELVVIEPDVEEEMSYAERSKPVSMKERLWCEICCVGLEVSDVAEENDNEDLSDEEWQEAVSKFAEAHSDEEQDEADDDDPWFDQVRAIVGDISF